MSSTTDKIKGMANEAAGAVKQSAGKAVGNPNLEVKGTLQKGVVARRISRAKSGLYHPDHAVSLEERTESGRPASSMRFRTATPMAASVC